MEEQNKKYYVAVFTDSGKLNGWGEVPFIAEGEDCIEVEKEICDNIKAYGNNYYIYRNLEFIVNPNYEQEKLTEAKDNKKDEALSKAYDFEENGTVEYKNCVFEMSLKNRDNLRDTVEALATIGQTETTWNDKNDNLVVLTLEDIQYIRLNLILGRIQSLWITQYPEYLTAIEEATTVEEVEAIEIDYSNIKEE